MISMPSTTIIGRLPCCMHDILDGVQPAALIWIREAMPLQRLLFRIAGLDKPHEAFSENFDQLLLGHLPDTIVISDKEEHGILAHQLAAGALVVAGVEVGEFRVHVILLTDEPALFGEGAGRDAL